MIESKKLNNFRLTILIFILLAQLLPQFITFFSDICLVIGTILFSKYSKKIIIYFIPFFFISILILVFKGMDQAQTIASGLRIFFVINLAIVAKEISSYQSKKILKIILPIIIFFTLGFNLIGFLNVELYKELVSYWNGEYRKLGVQQITVTEMTASYRLSSFFPQPASSGFFHSVLILFFLMIFFYHRNIFLLPLIAAIYYSGLISLSSIIEYFYIVLFVSFFYYKLLKDYRFQIFFVSLISIIVTYLVFIFFADESSYVYKIVNKITGGRHYIDGNHYEPFIKMGLKEYFYGYSFESARGDFHRAIGDSSFLTKLFLGGIFYYLSYIFFISLSYMHIFKTYCADKFDQYYFVTYFLLLSFIEIGIYGYSQPQISILSLMIFCLFFNYKNKKE